MRLHGKEQGEDMWGVIGRGTTAVVDSTGRGFGVCSDGFQVVGQG